MLGIVIGVAAVISTMSVGRGAQQVITSQIESLGTNLLFVRPADSGQGAASTLTMEDAEALIDSLFAPSITAVAPEIGTSAQIVAGR
ncbi:MAG: ABC transporter permease, partial [Gemmatimonadetes bacterium]|nr:ABC transporter permease [Gemmatimonadota bacterium]